MAVVEGSITVNAPVEKVFGYFETPDFLQKCVPSLVEVKLWEQLPTGGHCFQCVHKMGGRTFDGELIEQTEFVPNSRIVEKSERSFPKSTSTYIFEAEGGGTKLTVRSDVTVPIPLLGKLAAVVLSRLVIKKELRGGLANLKKMAEGDH